MSTKVNQGHGIRTRQLDAHRQLRDAEGIANAQWGLAQIDLARHDVQGALPRLREAFEILARLQSPDGLAVVGHHLGQILIAAGQPDVRQVLMISRDAAVKIGWASMAGDITELLDGDERT